MQGFYELSKEYGDLSQQEKVRLASKAAELNRLEMHRPLGPRAKDLLKQDRAVLHRRALADIHVAELGDPPPVGRPSSSSDAHALVPFRGSGAPSAHLAVVPYKPVLWHDIRRAKVIVDCVRQHERQAVLQRDESLRSFREGQELGHKVRQDASNAIPPSEDEHIHPLPNIAPCFRRLQWDMPELPSIAKSIASLDSRHKAVSALYTSLNAAWHNFNMGLEGSIWSEEPSPNTSKCHQSGMCLCSKKCRILQGMSQAFKKSVDEMIQTTSSRRADLASGRLVALFVGDAYWGGAEVDGD